MNEIWKYCSRNYKWGKITEYRGEMAKYSNRFSRTVDIADYATFYHNWKKFKIKKIEIFLVLFYILLL